MTLRRANPKLAAALMLLATAFIAATMLLAKMLRQDVLGDALHPLQVSHGRFLFALMFLGTVAAVMRPRLARPDWGLHISRTLCGWGGVTLMFASVAYIPLPDATAISFLNPVFGMLLAIPLLGEKIGLWRWVAVALALIGALILLRPGPDSFQLAALLALGAAMVLGLELIFIKKLANKEPDIQILLINNVLGLIISSCAVLPFWTPPTPAQWVALAALGCMMAAAQTCFVNAMARADASFVTPLSYVTLIFVALYDLIIFDVVPDWVSIIGAFVILTGATLLAWRENRNVA